MVRFGFNDTPKYIRIELENREYASQINEMFIAKLSDKIYLIGRLEKIESVFIKNSEHYYAIVKTTSIIVSNKDYELGKIPIIPL